MSSRVTKLIERYTDFCSLPWESGLSGVQKVWFAVYDKTDERRIRAQVDEFEIATKQAGHGWRLVDVTDSFADWIGAHEYRNAYFESPEDLAGLMPEYEEYVADLICEVLEDDGVDDDTVVAVQGIASLFGFVNVSAVMGRAAPSVRGRLLVLFPGEHEDNNYRLLDARDGWNYMAIPITAH